MQRLVPASIAGIALSIILAASIQAYDEPKAAGEAAKGSACSKKTGDCSDATTTAVACSEDSKSGECCAADKGACCQGAADCPVLQSAQNACGTGNCPKSARTFAIKLRLNGCDSATADKSQCNCCEKQCQAASETACEASACSEKDCSTECEKLAAKIRSGDCDSGCSAISKSDCSSCEVVAKGRKLRDGEAAKVLIEVLDRIGPSVLEGTVFDTDDGCATECQEPLSIRQQLVQYVDKLESGEFCAKEGCSENCELNPMVGIPCGVEAVIPWAGYPPAPPMGYAPTPYVAMPPTYYSPHPVANAEHHEAAGQEASVAALRDAAETLERTAAQLERHNLYDSSDLTREIATHLRLQSRRMLRHESEPSDVETTKHEEMAPPDGDRHQAWYYEGVRVPRR